MKLPMVHLRCWGSQWRPPVPWLWPWRIAQTSIDLWLCKWGRNHQQPVLTNRSWRWCATQKMPCQLVFQCFLSFCMSFYEISFELTALLTVSAGQGSVLQAVPICNVVHTRKDHWTHLLLCISIVMYCKYSICAVYIFVKLEIILAKKRLRPKPCAGHPPGTGPTGHSQFHTRPSEVLWGTGAESSQQQVQARSKGAESFVNQLRECFLWVIAPTQHNICIYLHSCTLRKWSGACQANPVRHGTNTHWQKP